MILAAADAGADPNAPLPRELVLGRQIERWGVLPNAGGLLDQSAGLLARIEIAENVYNALLLYTFQGPPPGGFAKWAESHKRILDIVRNVEALRRIHLKAPTSL